MNDYSDGSRWASSGRRGSPARSCCACARSTRISRCAWPPGTPRPGTAAAELYPSLAAAYPHLTFSAYDPAALDGLDLVFLGLPHGASQAIVPELIDTVGHLVDLAADFRLSDPALYPQWYGAEHTAPELLDDFAYGLPELGRQAEIEAADHVATPGCYPTAAALALAPLVRAGAVRDHRDHRRRRLGRVGGRAAAQAHHHLLRCRRGLHRLRAARPPPHPGDGAGSSGPTVLFTPHLAPMSRGILATCYARPAEATSTGALLEILRTTYAEEPFVVVTDGSPSTKATLGSNCAHVTARYDERTGWVVAIAAIDNLTKGASGAAVQCANLLLGLPETTGLPIAGVYP